MATLNDCRRAAWQSLTKFASEPAAVLAVDLFLATGIAALALTFYIHTVMIHHALCNFYGDLSARVAQSDNFLAQYKGDFRIGDYVIPRAQIVAQNQAQHATLDSLKDLNC